MRGDFSRDTFKPANHHSAVRLQQGRVITDADWNEQADITRWRVEREAADVIGSCGAPEAAAGFAVGAAMHALGVFALGDDAWAVGEDGVIVSTFDGGASFIVHDSGTTAALRSVHFANAITGWAVGDGGTILHTADGGMSWTAQASGTTVALRSVFALDATRAWAVGDGGTVLQTTDGGAAWTLGTLGGGRLHAVRFADAARGWLAGQGGRLATTEDGGATWTPRDAGTKANLRALEFADAVTGWAAGDGGAILGTLDGGATWTPQTSSVAVRLRAIAFVGSTNGWAVGDDGIALRTVDGGATWVREDIASTTTLRGVALASNALGWIVGDESLAVRVGTAPLSVNRRQLPAASLSLGPGRLYVDGVLCELEARASFYAQPDRRVTTRLPAGTHLIYLDVWQRYLSHLENPAIREVALGGPDTAGRSRTVWQARALPVGPASPPPSCLSDLAEMSALAAPSSARLRARAEPGQVATNVGDIGASAGFRRLENQLYRVEVHAGGAAPAFKWSRENGSVAYAIESIATDPVKNETVVTLASRGLDDNLDLGIGDWVEIVDDNVALEPGAGPLLQYLHEGNDPREVVMQGVLAAPLARDPARHPLLRRWEQKPAGGAPGTLPIAEGTWIDLEEGVQVWFAPGGTYRPGDYWLIPARTITGDVEWERDVEGEPLARRPDGVAHSYCRLALVDADLTGTLRVLSDCRDLFPPLTAMTQLLYVSGDGQDGIPGVTLPQPLAVRVARGSHPVAAARVRFEIETGNGHLVGAPPGVPLEVPTGTGGVALCEWALDPDPAPARSAQRVRATLIDADDQDVEGQAVAFCATGTVSLQYVGGDGQDGISGQTLTYPLQLRVANGQRPVPGARIRFTVTGGGTVVTTGGATVGANPVSADADGQVAVLWRLGGALPQQVEAALLDAADSAVQRLVFSAAFRPQGDAPSTSPCVTIGKGGDVDALSTAVLSKLIAQHKGRLCLCLLAGDHVVEGLEVDGADGQAHVSIHGCGPASRIVLVKPAILSQFASFRLESLGVAADPNCGFDFRNCAEVTVASVTAQAKSSASVPLFRFSAASAVTVRDSRIGTRGVAVVFDDAQPVARVIDSEIDGVLSFYGDPVRLPDSILAKLSSAVKAVTFKPEPGHVFVRDCRLQVVAVGKMMVELLTKVASGDTTLPQLFRAGTLAGNVIAEPQNAFVSRTLTLTSCSFLHEATTATLGVFVAESATAVGNLANPDDAFPFVVITKPGRMVLDPANLVFMRH